MSWHKFARVSLSLLPCVTLVACGDDKSATDTDAVTASATETGTAGMTETGGTAATPGTTEPGPTTGTSVGPTTGDPTAGTTTTDTTVGPSTDTSTTGGSACPYTPVDGDPGVALEVIATGFDRPLMVRPDPSNPDRLFVAEQGGRIKILEPGQNTAPDAAFLDIDVKNKVPNEIGPEQGLLGFDFHPDFPADPRIYVNYNPGMWQGPGPTYVSEFTLDPNNPNQVDPASERLVIAIDQPAPNHNGGWIEFGPDGYLYIGMGDGGGANDQYDTGREPSSLHAKILRIGVEPDGTPDSNVACNNCDMMDGFDYTIPGDNPFVADPNFTPEVYAWGLRNPWRCAFDPPTDGLYCADVGQNQWEEVDVIVAGGDYGWSLMEGNHCFGGGNCDDEKGLGEVNDQGMTLPIAEYNHGSGCSITGGRVYRSCEVPAWDGVYFYGDYCSGRVWAVRWDGETIEDFGQVTSSDDNIFGSGYNGHGDVLLTVVQVNAFNQPVDGKLLRVVPQ